MSLFDAADKRQEMGRMMKWLKNNVSLSDVKLEIIGISNSIAHLVK